MRYLVSSGSAKDREVHASDIEAAAKKFVVEGRPKLLGRTILVKGRGDTWLVDTGQVLKKIGMLGEGKPRGYKIKKVRMR